MASYGSPLDRLTWSPAEKAIARNAFDKALQREFAEVIRKTKQMAASIEEPSQLWELERYLASRGKHIDEQIDNRYSRLPMLFGVLIREHRLSEEDLRGLGEEKLEAIRKVVNL